jgi:hypothetical protein
VIKAEEWPSLLGIICLALNWHFTPQIEGGGRGNGRGMWSGARGSGSMAGEAEAVVSALFSTGRKKKAGWAGWARRSSRPAGRLGRLGQKLKEIPFRNKYWIFEFTRALKICTRRFRRNLDTRIFPKFF